MAIANGDNFSEYEGLSEADSRALRRFFVERLSGKNIRPDQTQKVPDSLIEMYVDSFALRPLVGKSKSPGESTIDINRDFAAGTFVEDKVKEKLGMLASRFNFADNMVTFGKKAGKIVLPGEVPARENLYRTVEDPRLAFWKALGLPETTGADQPPLADQLRAIGFRKLFYALSRDDSRKSEKAVGQGNYADITLAFTAEKELVLPLKISNREILVALVRDEPSPATAETLGNILAYFGSRKAVLRERLKSWKKDPQSQLLRLAFAHDEMPERATGNDEGPGREKRINSDTSLALNHLRALAAGAHSVDDIANDLARQGFKNISGGKVRFIFTEAKHRALASPELVLAVANRLKPADGSIPLPNGQFRKVTDFTGGHAEFDRMEQLEVLGKEIAAARGADNRKLGERHNSADWALGR